MRFLYLITMLLSITACKTSIIDHYDCSGKEELVSKTYVQCIEAEKPLVEVKKDSIKKNSVYACKDSVQELLCSPVYKEIL